MFHHKVIPFSKQTEISFHSKIGEIEYTINHEIDSEDFTKIAKAIADVIKEWPIFRRNSGEFFINITWQEVAPPEVVKLDRKEDRSIKTCPNPRCQFTWDGIHCTICGYKKPS